jgi:hypothetical protein
MSPSLVPRRDERRRAPSLGFLCLALASSCTATPEVIEGEDREVFAPRLLASLPLGSSSDEHPLALDLELANDTGDFSQTLEATEFVQLDDLRIDGPGEVETEFSLSTASLALHKRLDSDGRLSFGWAAGVEWTHLDIEVSSGALKESDVRDALGPRFALELAFEMRDDLEAFARDAFFFGSSDTYQTVLDLGAAWRVHPSFGLIFGWHFGYLEDGDDSTERSRIELRSSGPFVTLALSLPRRAEPR